MATTNRSLFSWDDVENLPDLKRLSLVLDYIPDEKIVQALPAIASSGEADGYGEESR
jgi:hypothetical protein